MDKRSSYVILFHELIW